MINAKDQYPIDNCLFNLSWHIFCSLVHINTVIITSDNICIRIFLRSTCARSSEFGIQYSRALSRSRTAVSLNFSPNKRKKLKSSPFEWTTFFDETLVCDRKNSSKIYSNIQGTNSKFSFTSCHFCQDESVFHFYERILRNATNSCLDGRSNFQ